MKQLNKLTIKDIDLKNKKIIMRVDFNVPLDEKGNITDDTRIRASLETIKYILNKEPNKLILMSHLGRPDGKVVEKLRMDKVAEVLSNLLNHGVKKLNDCVGEEVKKEIISAKEKVILLENLRFHPEEEEGDENFAKALASLAEIYVNDAFGTAHRAHASTAVIAKFLPSCVGFLMQKEITYLKLALNPNHPYVIILGGAKVSDKIGIIENLIEKADALLIGGAMAYTFLKVQGEPTGKSKVELDKLDLAKKILEKIKQKNIKVLLPVDHVVCDNLDKPTLIKEVEKIHDGFLGVDIGKKTIDLFKKELENAHTILWNGPVGIFEKDAFSKGTKEIALILASLKKAITIVGGGDTASAAKKFNIEDKVSHVSTGGGASLEFLEGKELPGIAMIPDKK